MLRIEIIDYGGEQNGLNTERFDKVKLSKWENTKNESLCLIAVSIPSFLLVRDNRLS